MRNATFRLHKHNEVDARRKLVLILSAYFVPESAAYIHLMLDLIQTLEGRGFEVEVLAPTPTRGVSDSVRREYSDRKFERIGPHSMVRRFWLPRERGGAAHRALRYVLQNAYQTFYGLTHTYDVLFLYSTPPTNGFMGAVLRKLRKRPLIYNVQDVFPDSLVSAGMAAEGSLPVRIGQAMESFAYANSDEVVAIGDQIKDNLVGKGVDETKVSVVYNWVDDTAIHPVARKDNRLFQELGLDENSFVVAYAGNVGMAQGIDVLIEAAALLRDEHDISFVVIGSGACLDSCVELARRYHLTNVTFAPVQSLERVSEVYSLGDVSLVSCRAGFGGCGLPSKTCSIMATETPVIASFDLDSELASIVRQNKIGVVVPAGDARGLADAILSLKTDGVRVREYGRNGRALLTQRMSRRVCCNKLADIVERCIE